MDGKTPERLVREGVNSPNRDLHLETSTIYSSHRDLHLEKSNLLQRKFKSFTAQTVVASGKFYSPHIHMYLRSLKVNKLLKVS